MEPIRNLLLTWYQIEAIKNNPKTNNGCTIIGILFIHCKYDTGMSMTDIKNNIKLPITSTVITDAAYNKIISLDLVRVITCQKKLPRKCWCTDDAASDRTRKWTRSWPDISPIYTYLHPSPILIDISSPSFCNTAISVVFVTTLQVRY